MNLKYCLTGILCLFLKSDAQIKPLTIGDKVPDVTIKNIYNYPALQSNLSAFNNKLLILDFMATTCTGCIKLLPHLDSLQKEFGDQIQIFLISYEKREKVINFIKKNIYARLLPFPIATDDTLLSKFFPHTFISHEVWIKDNVVKAITSGEQVTAKSISFLLENNNINLPVKTDKPSFDFNAPLLATDVHPAFYSLLTGFVKDASAKNVTLTDTLSKRLRITMFNLSILSLYFRSYGLQFFPESFITFETKNTAPFIYDKSDKQWRQKNTYCYEVTLPLGIAKAMIGEKIRNDLDTYFGLKGRIEKRKIRCNIVVRGSSPPTIFPSLNTSVNIFLSQLNSRYLKEPFINESGGDKKIYVDAAMDYATDEESAKQILRTQGFDIIEGVREVEVFVLSEN